LRRQGSHCDGNVTRFGQGRDFGIYAAETDAHALLQMSPFLDHVAELLARQLDSHNKYLIDVKRQYDGYDHIGMVDEVLETLMRRTHSHPSA
jgi:hypothetical protein